MADKKRSRPDDHVSTIPAHRSKKMSLATNITHKNVGGIKNLDDIRRFLTEFHFYESTGQWKFSPHFFGHPTLRNLPLGDILGDDYSVRIDNIGSVVRNDAAWKSIRFILICKGEGIERKQGIVLGRLVQGMTLTAWIVAVTQRREVIAISPSAINIANAANPVDPGANNLNDVLIDGRVYLLGRLNEMKFVEGESMKDVVLKSHRMIMFVDTKYRCVIDPMIIDLVMDEVNLVKIAGLKLPNHAKRGIFKVRDFIGYVGFLKDLQYQQVKAGKPLLTKEVVDCAWCKVCVDSVIRMDWKCKQRDGPVFEGRVSCFSDCLLQASKKFSYLVWNALMEDHNVEISLKSQFPKAQEYTKDNTVKLQDWVRSQLEAYVEERRERIEANKAKKGLATTEEMKDMETVGDEDKESGGHITMVFNMGGMVEALD